MDQSNNVSQYGCVHCVHQPSRLSFSVSDCGKIHAVEHFHFDTEKITETRHTVILKMGVQNSSVLEVNDFEQSSANGLYHCAFDLIAQAIRVDDRAALERFHHAKNLDIAS